MTLKCLDRVMKTALRSNSQVLFCFPGSAGGLAAGSLQAGT